MTQKGKVQAENIPPSKFDSIVPGAGVDHTAMELESYIDDKSDIQSS
jgi:hypothetical protein